jgi:phosphotransferase system enzyme I (PtsI)
LRVAAEHSIALLLPVVGSVEEVRAARQAMGELQRELDGEGVRLAAPPPLGAMIEVPAAALIVDALAREVDFFSLGTNDLVQYLLAADREDEDEGSAYQPLHPAALRLIEATAQAARRAERPLTICGEMAGNPAYTELLLGLGLRRFSVGPGELLEVKRAIRGARLDEAAALAQAALALGTGAEIEALLAARGGGQVATA